MTNPLYPEEQFAGNEIDDGWIPDPPSVAFAESGPDEEEPPSVESHESPVEDE